jgi:hypothetical protein
VGRITARRRGKKQSDLDELKGLYRPPWKQRDKTMQNLREVRVRIRRIKEEEKPEEVVSRKRESLSKRNKTRQRCCGTRQVMNPLTSSLLLI